MESWTWATENKTKLTRSCCSVLCLTFDCGLNQNIAITFLDCDVTDDYLKINPRTWMMMMPSVWDFPTAGPSF